jgi:hypothetical protein
VEGEIDFDIMITDSVYSTGEVCQNLLSGDLHVHYGDTEPYGEDHTKVIGIVEWFGDRGDFVPCEMSARQGGKDEREQSHT